MPPFRPFLLDGQGVMKSQSRPCRLDHPCPLIAFETPRHNSFLSKTKNRRSLNAGRFPCALAAFVKRPQAATQIGAGKALA
uniref:Uncharacterized protein n=1 Tax=uncultured alpha proteobacterium HF0130_06E21 TaxID=710808 RepID=E0XT00_9PROT|nr:hypothetical protein [uncultured alpha proteobacterium HF0130_06E21]